MNNTQVIQNPLGVMVFGSAVLRVEPDIASLRFTVSRYRAVAAAHEKAKIYCEAAGVKW
jgi:hypothetical protein